MSKKRRQHTSSFKRRVAIEAIKGNLTLSEISSKYNIASSVVSRWKRDALSHMEIGFEENRKTKRNNYESHDLKELHAKIGELTLERDFLLKAYDQ